MRINLLCNRVCLCILLAGLCFACAETASQVDSQAPLWADGYPRLAQVTNTSAQLLVRIQESGLVHFTLLPAGLPAPTSSQLQAGTSSGSLTNHSLALEQGPEVMILFQNLHPVSNYTIYLASEDQASPPNLQANPLAVPIVRDDPPGFYTLSYATNGAESGSVPAQPGEYFAGQEVGVLGNTGNLIRTDHVFRGWTNAAGISYVPGSTFTMPNHDVTFYPWWEGPHAVVYNATDADGGSVPVDGQQYTNGQVVPVAENSGGLYRSGYSFSGWTNAGGTWYPPGTNFSMGSSDVTLYAHWEQPGRSDTYTAGSISFNLICVPGGIHYNRYTNESIPTSVAAAFLIGECEVSYQVWDTVYDWATNNGFSFAHAGRQGGDGGGGPVGDAQHPVTTISWRDAMVWCNALTQYYNDQNGTSLQCVYYYDAACTSPITDSLDDDSHGTESGGDYTSTYNPNDGGFDRPYVKTTADGFRLPTADEWELAARYIRDNGNKILDQPGEYYPGNYASGADAAHDQAAGSDFDGDGDSDSSGDVAWYSGNAGATHAVTSSTTNALGCRAMSGNVSEWCYLGNQSLRQCRGGDFDHASDYLQVGGIQAYDVHFSSEYIGLRVARSAE